MDWSFPSSSAVKNLSPYTRGKRSKFNLWVGKIPWSRAWQPTPVFLPEKYHRQRSLAGYSPWGHKELDMTGASEHAYQTLFMRQCVHITYICIYKHMWVTKSWTRLSNWTHTHTHTIPEYMLSFSPLIGIHTKSLETTVLGQFCPTEYKLHMQFKFSISHIKKVQGSYFTISKIISKWIKDLYERVKSINS